MNVLIAGESSGGAFTFVRTLARELDLRGCQVTLALSGPAQPRGIGSEGVELVWRPGRVEWMRDPWEDVDATGAWLLELARRRDVEVVHVGGYAHAALPFAAPVVLTAHFDLLTWSRAVRDAAPGPELAEYERRVREALEGQALLVAPTAAHLSAIEAVHGAVPRARVIHHGTPPLPQPGPKQSLVLAAGRFWDEGKNLAALRGLDLPRRWSMAVAGPRRHPEGGSAALAGARVLGELGEAEMRGWLDRAAIFANPARYEPFGLAALEAAQAGCALVLSDIPSLRELWHGAAVFVKASEPESLATAFDLLTSSEALVAALGRAARARAERFTASAMADAYLSTYFELARAGALMRAS